MEREREGGRESGRIKGWREWTAVWPELTRQRRPWIFKSSGLTAHCRPVCACLCLPFVLIVVSVVRRHKCVMCGCVFCEETEEHERRREREFAFVFLFSWSSLSHSPLIFLHCVCVLVYVCVM